jgi:hypothetical protein
VVDNIKDLIWIVPIMCFVRYGAAVGNGFLLNDEPYLDVVVIQDLQCSY